jgi:hypothetical protein
MSGQADRPDGMASAQAVLMGALEDAAQAAANARDDLAAGCDPEAAYRSFLEAVDRVEKARTLGTSPPGPSELMWHLRNIVKAINRIPVEPLAYWAQEDLARLTLDAHKTIDAIELLTRKGNSHE